MRVMAWFLAMGLCFAVPAAAQSLYKCTVNGRASFQSLPCADAAVKPVTVRPASGVVGATTAVPAIAPSGAGSVPAENSSVAGKDRQSLARMQRDRHLLEADRAIASMEGEISNLRRSMEREMADLRESKRYSSGNLAGMTRDQALSTEMEAIALRTQVQINEVQERLKVARAKRERLLGS